LVGRSVGVVAHPARAVRLLRGSLVGCFLAPRCPLSTPCCRQADSYNGSVDMLDIFALSGLEWVYGRFENRFGRAVA
jgi:hypothetical protein